MRAMAPNGPFGAARAPMTRVCCALDTCARSCVGMGRVVMQRGMVVTPHARLRVTSFHMMSCGTDIVV